MKNRGPMQLSSPWPKHFLPSSNYQSSMTMVLNYSLISNKHQPHISQITFTSGADDVVCAKMKPPNNNILTGFSDHLSLSSVKMWLPPSPNQKKKPSVRLKNMTSSIHNQGTYTQYFLTSQNRCHSAKINLGCLTQQTD
jgi:hypothetical protein